MAGSDQPLPTDSFGNPAQASRNPATATRQTVPGGGAPSCALELSQRQKERNLQGLPFLWIFVCQGHRRFLLLLYECQMSTDGANDSVSDVSICLDADQRFDQTVVAEHMSTAQGPLSARQTLITHRTLELMCILLALRLEKCHGMFKSLQ